MAGSAASGAPGLAGIRRVACLIVVRICLYGAGAIGGYLAVRLAQSGEDVSIIARGPHLRAIREGGLTLKTAAEQCVVGVRASAQPDELGPQDCIIVTLKANALTDLPHALTPLLHEETTVVFAQNGIPWWYALGLPATALRPPDLTWLDPAGSLRTLRPRTIGAVVFTASEVIAPGVVQHNSPTAGRVVIGEIDDRESQRLISLRTVLTRAGILSPVPPSIRQAMWTKLMNNMTGSVVSALLGEPTRRLRKQAHFTALLERSRAEAVSIAEAHGYAIASATPRTVPAIEHTSSILQDYQRRRPMEIDALVVAPLAFARAAGLKTPTLDLTGALVAHKAACAGLYTPTRPFPIAV